MIVGDGDYRYRVNADWAKLPDGWSFKEVGGVGVDTRDNVYVFNRGDHPMIVFDRNGNFLRSWGEGQYPRAHGIHYGISRSIARARARARRDGGSVGAFSRRPTRSRPRSASRH